MSMLRDLLAKFDALNEGQNAAQRSVPQLPAEFKPRDISPVLGAPEKKHPTSGYFVGGESKDSVKEYMPLPEPITDDTIMELSPETLASYRAAARADKAFNQRGIDTALDRAARDQKPGRAEWEDEAEFLKSVNAKRDRGLRRAGDDINEISDFKRREIEHELRHEKNNYEVSIDGRGWKVFADRAHAEAVARKLQAKGKKAQVHATGAPVTEGNFEESYENEPPPKPGSLEYRALKRMKGPTQEDAIEALVIELGLVKFKSENKLYREYVPALMHHYRKQVVAEMDKSAPQPGRDGKVSHSTYGSRDKKGSDYFKGKEAPGKPITAKQAAKDALDILKKQGVAEGKSTTEDLVSKNGKNLGDYLQDVAKIIKKDPELLDRLSQDKHGLGPAVKTLHTDDGHEIKIHGNEDDGFRISIKDKAAKGQFRDLDEARMAVELFVARRRKHSAEHSDYVDEK